MAKNVIPTAVEQFIQTGFHGIDPQQLVRSLVTRNDPSGIIAHQNPRPGAVEVIRRGIQGDLEMIGAKLTVDEPVFHGLGKQANHAQGVGLGQVGIAEHAENTGNLPVGIENRCRRTNDASVRFQEMFVSLNLNGSADSNRGANGVGAAVLLLPVCAGLEPGFQPGLGNAFIAPAVQYRGVLIGEQNEAAAVGKYVPVVGQNLSLGNREQFAVLAVYFFQPGRLRHHRCWLMVVI